MYKTIYISENDKNISSQLASQFNNNDDLAVSFDNGLELLLEFSKKPCDLIIVNSDSPIVNGYDLSREIRKTSDVPIIMISQRLEKDCAISAFDSGCDDFIEFPIDVREIYIKSKIIFKRIGNMPEHKRATVLTHNTFEINLNAHTAKINNQPISLTPKEFNLLVLLIENKNQVFSREQIIQNVWQYDIECDIRQVDHLIKRLRKKLKQYSDDFKIDTVWGLGYKLST